MELHWRHPEVFSEEERMIAEKRIVSLSVGHTDLIDVRITASVSKHHRHGGHQVRIVCQARDEDVVASRTRADVGRALHDALDAFEGEIRSMRERRNEVRPERVSRATEFGVIDRVFPDSDYGFILTDSGDRVYFHRHSVRDGLDFERLEEGQRIGLSVEGGRQGLQAKVVVAAPPGRHRI